MANFPTSVYSPSVVSAGQSIDASRDNGQDAELTAIEQGYLQGTAPLNSSNSTVASLSVTGGSTIAGLLTVGGVATLSTGQLVFPATQNAAAGVNTLDDYEEGSWTPVIGGDGGTSGQ